MARWVPAAILLAGVVTYSRLPAPRVPSWEEIEAKTRMLELYRGKGEHFALDADLPVMAGKRLWYQYSGTLVLEREGLWDPEPLVNDIRSKRFSTLELYDLPRQYLVSERVEAAIRAHYAPFLRQFGRVWLAPKDVKRLPPDRERR